MVLGIRHGLVANPGHVVYARLPGFGLAPEGREAAADLARTLARAPVAAVVASPLERAVETAEILAAPHGLPVSTDERLLEWSFWGRWAGVTWERIRERDPDLLDVYAADPGAANPGDTLADAARGVLAWADGAEAAHRGGLVLGVSHEAPLAAALLAGRGEGFDRFHAVRVPHLACVRLRPGPTELVDPASIPPTAGRQAG